MATGQFYMQHGPSGPAIGQLDVKEHHHALWVGLNPLKVCWGRSRTPPAPMSAASRGRCRGSSRGCCGRLFHARRAGHGPRGPLGPVVCGGGPALYIVPRPLVHRPTRGHFDPNGFVVPKPAAAPPMAAGYGRSRVDIGRCEAQGGAPRPPPQPTGPRGPLGPCPAHLAPWRAVQAPTMRPIRPLAAQRLWSAATPSGHRWAPYGQPTHPRRLWAVPTPLGVPWGHWGRVVAPWTHQGAAV